HYTEPCTRTVCCKRYVTEQVMECRTICERVPYWTEKTIMKTTYVNQQVTEMRTRVVDHGHWECREVPVGGGGGGGGGGFFGRLGKKKGHGGDCCENACNACPATKTVNCWVPCKTTECYPCTVCKRVPVCQPCTVKVCCYKTVQRQVQCPVC